MVKVNEVEKGNVDNRMLRVAHRTINEVINLMRERNELYEVRLVYELQDETRRIEGLKNELELIVAIETDHHLIEELTTVIDWIEEEQEKYKL